MKKLIAAVVLLCTTVSLLAQTDGGPDNFNQAKLHLANHKLNQAIPILEKLWRDDPENANLNYLLGLCYVKEDQQIPKAVELLETASQLYVHNYESGSNKEKRAPEYVYYYLTIAYSKNKQCEEALRALNKFYQVYTYQDEYYLVDGQKWVRECNLEKKSEEPPMPALVAQRTDADKPAETPPVAQTEAPVPVTQPEPSPALTPEQKAGQEIMAEVIQERTEPQMKERLIPFDDWDNLRTKDVIFTQLTSQYGVQIASLIELKPTRDFEGLKNVEVYVDENGIFRYVIGRFPYRKQAESLLEKIKERGYSDAFIVDVNTPSYHKEVLGIGASSVNWDISGRVDFRVQVGAFNALVPGAVAQKYLEVDDIRENQQNGLTVLTVGNFETYQAAADYRESLKSKGLEDAFVVAFNLGNKIPLKEAIEFSEKAKTAP